MRTVQEKHCEVASRDLLVNSETDVCIEFVTSRRRGFRIGIKLDRKIVNLLISQHLRSVYSDVFTSTSRKWYSR